MELNNDCIILNMCIICVTSQSHCGMALANIGQKSQHIEKKSVLRQHKAFLRTHFYTVTQWSIWGPGSPWGPFWGFGSPLGPLFMFWVPFFNFRLKNVKNSCPYCCTPFNILKVYASQLYRVFFNCQLVAENKTMWGILGILGVSLAQDVVLHVKIDHLWKKINSFSLLF